MTSIAILIPHWQQQLELTQQSLKYEKFAACYELKCQLIAKYREWIAEGERRLGL